MMTTLEKQTSKNPMAKTWTKAGQIRRNFKAGRPLQKDRDLTPTAAIFETCLLLDKLRSAMLEADLDKEDVRAALAIKSAGFLYVVQVPVPKRLPELFAVVEKIENPVMVGVIFIQRDREAETKDPNKASASWFYPFRVLTSVETRTLLTKGLDMIRKKAMKMEFN